MPTNFPAQISISNDNREGITRVLFQLDPNLLDSIARKFYDSHIELVDGKPSIRPNSRFYVCPICGAIYDKELYAGYNMCTGKAAHEHDPTITNPKDWNPPLTDAGFNFLLASSESALSSNLATGNYGETSTQDVRSAKEKMRLEKGLMSNAHKMASFMINSLIGNFPRYVNKEIYAEGNRISNFFSYSFDYSFIMEMSRNIYSVLSKGKNLEAVKEIASNRLVYEESNVHEMGYSSRKQDQEQQGNDWFNKIFGRQHGI